MRLTTRPGNRPSLRSRRSRTQANAATPAIVIPAQTDLSEAYTWAVNAAVESDRPELALELARSYAREV